MKFSIVLEDNGEESSLSIDFGRSKAIVGFLDLVCRFARSEHLGDDLKLLNAVITHGLTEKSMARHLKVKECLITGGSRWLPGMLVLKAKVRSNGDGAKKTAERFIVVTVKDDEPVVMWKKDYEKEHGRIK